jgi:hypothetical protein
MPRRIIFALRRKNPLGGAVASLERRMLFDCMLVNLIDKFGYDWCYVGYTKKMMVIGIKDWNEIEKCNDQEKHQIREEYLDRDDVV